MEYIQNWEVRDAYRKLKSQIYYDNSNMTLFLRAQIAKYEKEKIRDSKKGNDANELFRSLEELYCDKINEKEIKELINSIKIKVLPKKISDSNINDNNNISDDPQNEITNNFTEKNQYFCDKIHLFIECPIELHVLSVLWLMRIGYRLDNDLSEQCYGNRLKLFKGKKVGVVQGIGLFQPYFVQYQRWQQEAIIKSKEVLKDNDVAIINLDIKDYYYSVNFDFDLLEEEYPRNIDENHDLHKLFVEIHIKFTELLKEYKYPTDINWDEVEDKTAKLPIGLLSSSVLANWYLKEFDRHVKEKINPIYYGRYVDDILFVFHKPSDTELAKKVDKSKIQKKDFVQLFLKNILKKENEKDIRINVDGTLQNLKIQKNKIICFYFSKDYSTMLIDKLKDDIIERASEFRYPDPEVSDPNFNSMAHELRFDDHLWKIRTLKDYKINKYGLSTFFAKRITSLLMGKKVSDTNEVDNVVSFFKGNILLIHYSLWEKIFTYLLILRDKQNFIGIYLKMLDLINKVEISETIYKKDNDKLVGNLNKELKANLLEHLKISATMAISLDPNYYYNNISNYLYSEIKRKSGYFINDEGLFCGVSKDVSSTQITNDDVTAFRVSNTIRHHYIKYPLLNYYKSVPDQTSLLDTDLFALFQEIKKTNSDNSKLPDFEELFEKISSSDLTPRKIKYYEFLYNALAFHINLFSERGSLENSSYKDGFSKKIIDDAFNIYHKINFGNREYVKKNKYHHKEKIRADIFENTSSSHQEEENIEYPNIKLVPFSIKAKKGNLIKPRFGIVNIDIPISRIKELLKTHDIKLTRSKSTDNAQTKLKKIFALAKKENVDIIMLPEYAFNFNYLPDLARYVSTMKKVIITGIEPLIVGDYVYNLICGIFPVTISGVPDALIIPRLKNHYAPAEEKIIKEYRLKVPKMNFKEYHHYQFRNLYFTLFYCFELTDIVIRSFFKSKIDFAVACEWNKDTKYFANIIEATSRDLHTYICQVNTSKYGDSRITQPSKSESMNILQVKGGENLTMLTGQIDIGGLRDFQKRDMMFSSVNQKFKPLPPNFNYESLIKRINDEPVF